LELGFDVGCVLLNVGDLRRDIWQGQEGREIGKDRFLVRLPPGAYDLMR
jgi:hypothetical protein